MALPLRISAPMLFGSRRAALLVERNIYVYRRTFLVIFSGFFEPLFYLLSIGLGIGGLIGAIPGPDGRPIPYELFIAPALLATSAMNGAIYDSTFNVFFKLNYEKTYEAILATPLGIVEITIGELLWALIRAALYAVAAAVVVAGLVLQVTPVQWCLLLLCITLGLLLVRRPWRTRHPP
jgi:lipooligosaccharide transport system permease protein